MSVKVYFDDQSEGFSYWEEYTFIKDGHEPLVINSAERNPLGTEELKTILNYIEFEPSPRLWYDLMITMKTSLGQIQEICEQAVIAFIYGAPEKPQEKSPPEKPQESTSILWIKADVRHWTMEDFKGVTKSSHVMRGCDDFEFQFILDHDVYLRSDFLQGNSEIVYLVPRDLESQIMKHWRKVWKI